ncbi:MAG: hypothetical protein MUO39_10745 [Steroidobacteraceae bacterium]|nr:hypothetical protein [Steroidobacteraceae bacterium]
MHWVSRRGLAFVRSRAIPPARLLVVPALLAALAVAAGCAPKSRDLQPGLYRARVELPGGTVPFGIDVAAEKTGIALYLVNGENRVRAPSVKAVPGVLTAALPGTGNILKAGISGDELDGEITLVDADGGKLVVPFSAVRGQAWRFVEEPRSDNADFSGRWTIEFTDDAGNKVPGVADFAQSFHIVTGSVRTVDREQPLVGDADDEELSLSFFDGQQVVLYKGKLNEHGELVGERWSTATGHARYTAIRNPDATL